ncbi:MAG: lysylphosphatidylglycerol synthase transmembrane domain-containing protein [Marmoricola sp.]
MWIRLLVGAGLLAIVVGRLGAGPFLQGIGTIDLWSLVLAAGIAVITTACCAWRWTLVARGLGIGLPLGAAIAAYYRSQFLNTTLPGGVLGDVHRGVRHGRDVDDVGRGLRAVAWERLAGQVVQVVVSMGVLLLLPSPVHSSMLFVVAAVAVAVPAAVLLAHRLPRDGPSPFARAVRTAALDLRDGLLARRAWPGIALASTAAVAGHAVTFLVAAWTVGVAVSPVRILPLALLVLLAMAIPTNVAGWGPREGVAAWAFAAAGLGAAQGVATSVVYGVMVLVANLPGAGVLVVAAWLRRGGGSPGAGVPRANPPSARLSGTAGLAGTPRG